MRTACILAVALLFLGGVHSARAQTTWTIDPGPSTVTFQVPHFYFAHVDGRFKSFRGTVVAPHGTDLTDATMRVTIPVRSVYTANRERDAHLVQKDFFWARRYPLMTFESTACTPTENGYTLIGDLTIRGVTHPITLAVTPGEVRQSPTGQVHAHYVATGLLERSAYGLRWNNVVEAGQLLVGDTVTLRLDITLVSDEHGLAHGH